MLYVILIDKFLLNSKALRSVSKVSPKCLKTMVGVPPNCRSLDLLVAIICLVNSHVITDKSAVRHWEPG